MLHQAVLLISRKLLGQGMDPEAELMRLLPDDQFLIRTYVHITTVRRVVDAVCTSRKIFFSTFLLFFFMKPKFAFHNPVEQPSFASSVPSVPLVPSVPSRQSIFNIAPPLRRVVQSRPCLPAGRPFSSLPSSSCSVVRCGRGTRCTGAARGRRSTSNPGGAA